MTMNPAMQPMEKISMLGPSDDFPGGPPGAPYPSTVVNIPAEPPKDHFIWSIICFAYSNIFCLGLAALIYSVKARDRKMMGDMNGAQHYASTARSLNILSAVLFSVFFVIGLITVIVVVVQIKQMHTFTRQNNYYYG
ncbi:dispanin subfamily A member 2b-like [Takifugu flavidus]|uniref:dispanin subfamily A member 2b-like n=1 Tax=Takifugu flavidus TaxID=433684 RepID=UPI002544290E|nr:dispanin subfamily A member 2b-like [Takifugu flavidus]